MHTKRYATEHIGDMFGVEIPDWLRAFDCRASEGTEGRKAPWGETLWGGERAMVDLGLKSGYGSDNATTPVSCSTYVDARKASAEELAKQVRDAVEAATRLRDEYEEGKKYPSNGNGGSCLYPPVGFAVSNYGWCIISDRARGIVRAFGWNGKR